MKHKLYIKLPEKVKQGDEVFVRARMDHAMESGWRSTNEGETIPPNRIREFTCDYNGKTVFKASFEAGAAPNPYLGFYIRASETGSVECHWITEEGKRLTTSAVLTVT
jgi:sulfur-oxidizing protein SoxZ